MVIDADTEWYLGVGMNLVGSITINLGTNVLKLAYTREAESFVKQESAGESELKGMNVSASSTKRKWSDRSRTWFIGMIIFVIGNILNFVSFAFAAQSLLAALEPAFVSNVIFGHFLLGLPVSRKVVLSTLLIIFGNIIIVFFSDHESRSYTTDTLISLYANPAYIIYLIFGTVTCLCCSIAMKHLNALQAQRRLSRNLSSLPALLYAVISGLLGTQSVIFAKALSNIVILTFQGDNQMSNPFSYFVLFCWLCSMMFWLKRMNNALIIFPGNRIIPVLQVVWILFGVISGGIYYEEFNEFTSFQVFMFTFGLILVMIGVSYLAPSTESHATDENQDSVAISISAMFEIVGSSNNLSERKSTRQKSSSRRSLELVIANGSNFSEDQSEHFDSESNELNLKKVFQ